jgi:hypothetical protein
MFRPLLLSLLALPALAPLASAQDWNRRVSDVHIVHPPGSPPGLWTVVSTVECAADGNTPSPVDLSFDLSIELNGTQIALLPVDDVEAVPLPCYWTTCGGGYCSSYWANNHHIYVGNCQLFYLHTGQGICGCTVILDVSSLPWSSYLTSTDSIRVSLSPSAGSLPEVETSDDSFLLALGDNPIGTAYCFGDGSLATACPCNNNGLPGRGCANSVNPGGAQLSATGWSQVDPATGTDSVVLHGSGMPATSTAIYLKGSSSNPNGATFGDGTRCVSGQLRRMRVRFNSGGASSFPIPGDPSLSTASQVVPGSGVTAYYQVYYRDPASFCTALTYNITNAVAIDW